MKPLLIIKTGSTAASVPAARGALEQGIADGLAPLPVCTVDVSAGETLPSWDSVAGAVVTGSPAMVSDRLPWSERTAAWLRTAMEQDLLPLLGICYGHQLLAHALGGTVDYHPRGREIGTTDIVLYQAAATDALFRDLPQRFAVHVTHMQSVVRLPQGAVRLAGNAFEPYQGLRFAKRAWGLQFHPEFDAGIMLAYVREREQDLIAEGVDIAALRAAVRDTPEAAALLQRFAVLVAD